MDILISSLKRKGNGVKEMLISIEWSYMGIPNCSILFCNLIIIKNNRHAWMNDDYLLFKKPSYYDYDNDDGQIV